MQNFTLQQIPCKHMFVVFSQSNWSWNDLPKSVITVSIWHWKYHHLVWMWKTKRWMKRQLNTSTTWLFHQPSPKMDWIYLSSHYWKKLELQNTGKRWGCRRKQGGLLWNTKSVNRNYKPPVNQSDIVYVMNHSVSAWRILLEDHRRKSSRGAGNWCPT